MSLEPPTSDGAANPDPLRGFMAFYKATVHRTFGVAYRASGGDEHVARDATQDAYVVMLKRWRDNTWPEGDPCRYVARVAVNKVADYYRSIHRWIPIEEEHDCGSDETRYAEVLDTMTLHRAVRDFLDGQPEQRRAVGVSYFLEERDYRKIADAFGMSCSTVRTHVQRLRAMLQPLIDQIPPDDEEARGHD